VTAPAADRPDTALFGESGARVIVTCSPTNLAALQALATDVPLTQIGTVAGDDVQVTVDGATVRLSIADARSAYESAIPEALM
jgi:phosphoribosylformylglycinamidine (FGAM) synthase-like enzyme